MLFSELVLEETVEFALVSNVIGDYLVISWLKDGFSAIIKDEVNVDDLDGIVVTDVEATVTHTQVLVYNNIRVKHKNKTKR